MPAEHVDVLIVGAGLSGVGFACHLQEHCPGKTYAILEARDAIGGTWDLFRYPGIRSDSDMFTLGYSFRPWEDGKAIADGPVDPQLHPRDRARARRRGQDPLPPPGGARGVVVSGRPLDASRPSAPTPARRVELTCSFLYGAPATTATTRATRPSSRASSASSGTIVHPQHWPEDLDYAGKRVVVIGSGATAVTLVPAMAERRRARDDAPALAELRRDAARGGPDRELAPAAAARPKARLRDRRAGRTCSCMLGSFNAEPPLPGASCGR